MQIFSVNNGLLHSSVGLTKYDPKTNLKTLKAAQRRATKNVLTVIEIISIK